MEDTSDIEDTSSKEGHSDPPSVRDGQLGQSEVDVPQSGEEEAATILQNNLCEERPFGDGLVVNQVQGTPIAIKEESHVSENHSPESDTSLTDLLPVQVKEEPDVPEYEPFADPNTSGRPSQLNLNTIKEELVVKEEPFEARLLDKRDITVLDGTIAQPSANRVAQEMLNCLECQEQFCSEAALLAHRESHQRANEPNSKTPDDKSHVPDQPSDIFICSYSVCRRQFLNKAGLNTHIWKSHQKGKARVNPPAENLGSTKKLSDHSNLPEKLTDTFSCCHSGCQKQFANKNELMAHRESHQNKKECLEPPGVGCGIMNQRASREVFICTHCGVSYNDIAHLNAHLRSHPEERPFPCDSCSRTFSRKSELINHLVTHSKRKPYACSVCGKRFTTQSGLVGHSRIHTGEKPFSCPECGKCFKDHVELHSHKQFHITEQPFECLECGRRFQKQSFLLTHQRCHTKEAQLCCQACGKSFMNNSTLEEHQKTHMPDEKYACMDCGEWFPNKASLETHFKSHIKERPYACIDCGKRYVLPSQLRKHRRIHASLHTDDKPYSCSDCGKSFENKSDLDAHQKIHQGKKPYRCSDCGKEFVLKHSLLRHLATHIVEVTIL